MNDSAKNSAMQRPLGIIAPHPDLTHEVVKQAFSLSESALANFITDTIVKRCRAHGVPAHAAMIDASVMQQGLSLDGPLTIADWLQLMPDDNSIQICRISGSQLRYLLMDNAFRTDRVHRPKVERGFLQFSQHIRYHIHLGKKRPMAHALQMQVEFQPIELGLNRSYILATHSGLRRQAKMWERYAEHTYTRTLLDIDEWSFMDTGLSLHQELTGFIMQIGGLTKEGGVRRDGRLVVHPHITKH